MNPEGPQQDFGAHPTHPEHLPPEVLDYPDLPPEYPAYPAHPGYPWYPPAYVDPYGYPARASTNGWAIASLIASLLGFFTCGMGSLIGMILGIIGMQEIKTRPQDGRGLAIAGIAIGAGYFLLIGGFFLVMLILGMSAQR